MLATIGHRSVHATHSGPDSDTGDGERCSAWVSSWPLFPSRAIALGLCSWGLHTSLFRIPSIAPKLAQHLLVVLLGCVELIL